MLHTTHMYIQYRVELKGLLELGTAFTPGPGLSCQCIYFVNRAGAKRNVGELLNKMFSFSPSTQPPSHYLLALAILLRSKKKGEFTKVGACCYLFWKR